LPVRIHGSALHKPTSHESRNPPLGNPKNAPFNENLPK
jgi:hypothetical protein